MREADLGTAKALGDRVGEVHTLVGTGLFDFGHVDGPAGEALMQHPLGIAAGPGGMVVVADTYNGAIRVYDPATETVSTLATGLYEPSDEVVHANTPTLPRPFLGKEAGQAGSPLATSGEPDTSRPCLAMDTGQGGSDLTTSVGPGTSSQGKEADHASSHHHRGGETRLLVVESSAHRIVEIPWPTSAETLDTGRRATERPPLDLPAGEVRLAVPFIPAPGHRMDERDGPATRLTVSATPSSLLIEGAGESTGLTRMLVLAPGEGVLHVTARAASCDASAAHPACHLVTQDWGIPVRVHASGAEAGGLAREVTLPLRG
jgi:hypothetical protein